MKFLTLLLILIGSLRALGNTDSYLLNSQEFKSLNRQRQAEYLKSIQKIFAAMAKQSLYMASEDETSTSSRSPASVIKPTTLTSLDIQKLVALKTGKKMNQDSSTFTDVHDVNLQKTVSSVASSASIKPSSKPVASADTAYFRCMYSGWVIKSDPCQAQQKFPENFKILGVDSSQMICLKNQTMCNPILFGLKLPKKCEKLKGCENVAKPLCVSKGAWPTEACSKLSSVRETQIAAEINSELNPAQYDSFVQDFANLCDDDRIQNNPFAELKNGKKRNVPANVIRRDIKTTCNWALEKMKVVSAHMKNNIDGEKNLTTNKKSNEP